MREFDITKGDNYLERIQDNVKHIEAFHDLSTFRANPEETSRLFPIEEHEYRDKFQRDRDRILYSKEFRRLSGKTQIFVTGSDDNMRNRLTHTLEVAQIAETISSRLQLNTMLTNAIAYGHDVGHTPFGHIGERTLNYIMNGCFEFYKFNKGLSDDQKGFKHNYQGVRVTSYLEEIDDADNGAGLNLTRYTLWGILNHTSKEYKECEYCKESKLCMYKNCEKACNGRLSVGFYKKTLSNSRGRFILDDERDWTFEAIVVAYADEIAQRHHDIEDGIIAELISMENLCDYLISDKRFSDDFRSDIGKFKKELGKKDKASRDVLIRKLSKIIIDYYVTAYSDAMLDAVNAIMIDKRFDLINEENAKKAIYRYVTDVKKLSLHKYFGFEKSLKDADRDFNSYLCNHILLSRLAQSMDGKAAFIIRQIVKAYLTNPQQLTDRTIALVIRDWMDKNGRNDVDKPPYVTDASANRKKLKDLMRENDPDIRGLLLRRIVDYIAGMTDRFAMECYDKLYGTKEYM